MAPPVLTTRCTKTVDGSGGKIEDCAGDDVNVTTPLTQTYHTANKNVMYTYFHALAETGLVEQSQRGEENFMEQMAIENS